METHKNPKAGNIPHKPLDHCWKNTATSMVHKIRKEDNRVLKPKARNKPPKVSEAAPIQAKNTGNRANIPPNSATSGGNQAETSNSPKFFSSGLQGTPNLLEPEFSVKSIPQKKRGMAKERSIHQCF